VARYYLSNDFWLDLIATIPSVVQIVILAAGIGVRLLRRAVGVHIILHLLLGMLPLHGAGTLAARPAAT